MKKHKTIWKWICGAVAALLIAFVAGAWAMFGPLVTAANSIEKLEDNLYSMEYDGDYGFDDFLAQGGAASDGELANYLVTFLSRGFYQIESDVQTGEFGCSTICAQDAQGGPLFGRNYDWAECRTMIVHTRPRDGYESLSTCCLDFLGFGEDYVPDGSMMEQKPTLAAIYGRSARRNHAGVFRLKIPVGRHRLQTAGGPGEEPV